MKDLIWHQKKAIVVILLLSIVPVTYLIRIHHPVQAATVDLIPLLQSDEPPTHIMQPGETLKDISERYGVSEDLLRDFNGMTYVDFVFVGQPLLLPLDPETLAPVTPQPTAVTPQLTPAVRLWHKVQPGETVSEIAKAYGVTQVELQWANGISNVDAIFVGQDLRIPPASRSDQDADMGESRPLLPPIPHTIKRGETLSEIAAARGLTTEELMDFNGISEPDSVYAGQILEFPLQPTLQSMELVTQTTTLSSTGELLLTSTLTTAATPNVSVPITSSVAITRASDAEQPSSVLINPTNDNDVALRFSGQNLTTSLNRRYSVRSGDSLYRIALRNGVDVDALQAINNLFGTEASALSVGQTLILPATEQATMLGQGISSRTIIKADDADGNVYVVQPGDNLSTIAVQHDLPLSLVMTANGIANPDSVFVGQRLVIPPPPSEEADSLTSALTSFESARRGYHFYTVNPGDTLSQIASNFDTTVMALIEYNGLPDEETVFKGLELRIPYGPPLLPRRLSPAPSSGTQFVVSLSRQQCWLMRGDYVDKAWSCSTGYGEWTTRLGSFQIKTRMELAKSSAYEMDMPYWLGIYDVGSFENGIHGLPVRWSNGEKVWSNLIGSPATYGCAMLHDDDASVLYNESYLGMSVHIIE